MVNAQTFDPAEEDPSSSLFALPEIDRVVDTAIVQLRHKLRAIHGDGPNPLALFVDPELGPPQSWMELLKKSGAEQLRLPFGPWEPSGIKRPWLVVLPDEEANERLVNASVRLGVEEALGLHDRDEGASPRSICAWLTPPPRFSQHWESVAQWGAQTATHLANQAVLKLEAHGKVHRRVWRFWDPRGLAFHKEALRDAQWSQLRGPVFRWFYLGQDGQNKGSLVEAPGSGCVADHYADTGIDLAPGQAAVLSRVGVAHKVQRLLPEWMAADEQEQRAMALPDIASVSAVLGRAQSYGLAAEVDLLSFARAAFTVHESFDQHPALQALLRDVQSKGMPEGAYAREARRVINEMQNQFPA